MHQEEPYLAELALVELVLVERAPVELALAWVPQPVAATELAAGDSELELPADLQLGELDQQSQPSRPPSFDRA
ncbi:unannotated protein [freshwater metagenome]|uniref:Unannotated protein n=1 Tax=freshwater metagenome TaxID=449393 RepID=A0A6J7UU48_9ZZZZ